MPPERFPGLILAVSPQVVLLPQHIHMALLPIVVMLEARLTMHYIRAPVAQLLRAHYLLRQEEPV